MPQLILMTLVVVFALIASRKLRVILLHRHLWRFLRTAFVTGLAMLLILAVAFGLPEHCGTCGTCQPT